MVQAVVLGRSGDGGRRRNVELAVCADDGKRDAFVGADLRALTVAVAAQPLPELARHVHHGPADGPLTARGVRHRHGLRRGDTGARQTEHATDCGERKQANGTTSLPPVDYYK